MKQVLLTIAFVIVFIAGLLIGWRFAQPTQQDRLVTADVILTNLYDRGFLVTKTLVFNEPVTIDTTQGVIWKDLLFGQSIDAQGIMEVNVGVDLQKISAADIEVTNDKVIVTVPNAELFDTRLVGPINVSNKQGLLKKLFDSDDGYNQALKELTRLAEEASTDETLMKIANEQAVKEVSRLLQLTVDSKEVQVVSGFLSQN